MKMYSEKDVDTTCLRGKRIAILGYGLAAIGPGVGAGAGTGIGYSKYEPRGDDTEIYVVMGLLIGAGAGAAAGMLFGQTRRKRVMVYSTD